ncbi:MAG: LysR family transcriptional regulator [Ramlibacter sp.]|nr:LysR family transcriptional regulator [Ramlibacter sp.]
MDSLRRIEAFCAVAQLGSFVAAADRLGLSRAAVSRLVIELEGQLGTRLLNRTTRKVSLTDSGSAYHERARQILDDLAEANAAASATTLRPAGRLRINVPVTFGNLHLAPLWGQFLQRHPQVELDITLTDRLVDLVDEGYDLAVRVGRPQSSSLVARPLATDRVVLCASPEYLRMAPAIRRIEDIADHSAVAYSLWSGGDAWTFQGPEGRPHSVPVHPCLRANSGDTCRAAALADQGLIFQPAFLVGPDLAAGRLVEILPHYSGPRLDIQALYPSRRHVPGKVRAMVDFLVAAFEHPAWT